MRIWHQSFTVLEDLPAYAERIRHHVGKVVGPGTEVVLHGVAPGTYPANYPGDDLSYSFLFGMHAHQWVTNALAAEREGYDAYAMCSLVDPMLREIRTLVDIPVVATGETCVHLASMVGSRFGILAFIEGLIPRYWDQINACGLGARCAGVRGVGFRFQDTLRAFDAPGPLIDRFRESARLLIQAGADVIIPGEVPLNVLLASEGVSRIDDVPLIDGLGATVKMAETMASLRATTGLSPSRRGWHNAAPRRERVEQVLDLYLADRWTRKGGMDGRG
ncbi:MAG: racemase [Burkholderiales bacterium]|nr:racemase [Burkholderiales bacterium]